MIKVKVQSHLIIQAAHSQPSALAFLMPIQYIIKNKHFLTLILAKLKQVLTPQWEALKTCKEGVTIRQGPAESLSITTVPVTYCIRVRSSFILTGIRDLIQHHLQQAATLPSFPSMIRSYCHSPGLSPAPQDGNSSDPETARIAESKHLDHRVHLYQLFVKKFELAWTEKSISDTVSIGTFYWSLRTLNSYFTL